ncbi:hypothetical protein AS593_04195 [Caulobacter vibrioides]|nr:hypothetical protein AS593_04195 [Caulobacter vibrioides]
MSDFPGFDEIDVHILLAGSPENVEGVRVGMGFLIGPRHVLTCAHVVAESLGDTDAWIDNPAPPQAPITLAFAFSNLWPQPITARIAAWWPQSSEVRARSDLDDVALLELLPETFIPPADVVIARRGPKPESRTEVWGNGVSADEQGGINFNGRVRGAVVGNRMTIRALVNDDEIVPGCSGAGVRSDDGVLGMVAERQQKQTGLFIPIDMLLRAPKIAEAWQLPPPTKTLVGTLASQDAPPSNTVIGDEDQWRRTPLRARLARYLHNCDRTHVFQPLEDATFVGRTGRQPVIGVFGSQDDDLPEHLFDRFQSHFLVEAGVYTRGEIVRLPPKWKREEATWRMPGQSADEALKFLKRRLMRALDAESTAPSDVRAALRASSCSKTLYSELFADQLDAPDVELLKGWSAYWAQIAEEPLNRALVHLLCVKPSSQNGPVNEEALRERVSSLASHGDQVVVVNAGLLACVDDRDLQDWLEEVAEHVPLRETEVFELHTRATSELLASGAMPRLNQLRHWLSQLNPQE